MSPTIINERGDRIIIYFNDHNPPHVHVKKDRKEARVQILPMVELIDQRDFNSREIKTLIDLVSKNHGILLDGKQISIKAFPELKLPQCSRQ